MYGERRKGTDKPKGYARGKSSGLARVESAVDLMVQPSMKQSDSLWIRIPYGKPQWTACASLRILGGFFRASSGEVCPKEAVVLFRVLAHGVVCSFGLTSSVFSWQRLLSAADFNPSFKLHQAQQITAKRGAEEFGDPTKLPYRYREWRTHRWSRSIMNYGIDDDYAVNVNITLKLILLHYLCRHVHLDVLWYWTESASFICFIL